MWMCKHVLCKYERNNREVANPTQVLTISMLHWWVQCASTEVNFVNRTVLTHRLTTSLFSSVIEILKYWPGCTLHHFSWEVRTKQLEQRAILQHRQQVWNAKGRQVQLQHSRLLSLNIFTLCIYPLTSTLAKLPKASPEDSDEGGSVVRSRLDVVVLSEEDVVTVLHAAETTHVQTLKTRRRKRRETGRCAPTALLTTQQNSGSPQTERIPLCVPTAESLRHSGKTTHCCPLQRNGHTIRQ